MKNTRLYLPLLVAAALIGSLDRAHAVSTDGTVTFSETTQNYNGGYDPSNVSVVWVVDGNGNFVKTLCRHANVRINYLAQWVASRGSYTNVDGVTSATLSSQPQTHTVTWDCRGTNGQVVADGTYYFRAEYTSSNGQGAYMSNTCGFVKGTTAVSTNYPDFTDAVGQFTGLTLTYVPAADIGITALSPSLGVVDSNVATRVTVTNLTMNPATFTVVVSNVTAATLIGTQTVTALSGRAVTNLIFNWSAAGLVIGEYSLRAVASTLVNESVTANNSLTGTIFLTSATAGDLAITELSPSVGVRNAFVPVTVTVTNVMSDATGPFTILLTGLPAASLTEYSNTWRVAASADDAEEDVAEQAVSISSSDLELAFDGDKQQIVGIRFRNVGIPTNATIVAASIQFAGRTNDTLNLNPIALTIKGQAADNAAVFTATASGISSRPDTAASVAWSPANWGNGESGNNARTPDLKNVVQEIVGRAGWAASNALVFKITGSGGRRAWSYNGRASAAPQLLVQWNTGVPSITSIQVANLAGQAETNVVFTWNTIGLTAGVYQASAMAGPLVTEVHTSDNTLARSITLRNAIHDLAVHSVSITPVVPPNVITNVIVTVTNLGDVAESAALVLRDITATPITNATRFVNALPAGARTNLVCTWNTTTNAVFALGYHTLQATLAAVPGETSLADNSRQLQVIVASGMTTNTLVAKNSVWRFLDQGLDLAAAPWQGSDYYDGFWDTGAAPLGYELPGMATTIGYGGVSSNRQVTTYFRREFTMDFPPATLAGRVMRTHSVVLYLNGIEIARQNLPPGAVGYDTLASNTVSGAAATNYFEFAVPPSALVVGRNLITAELHLAAVTNTTAGFALELTSVNPTIPLTPLVAATAIAPAGPVQSGDRLAVSIALVNNGNTATSCLVLLKDATTGEVLASQTVATLASGERTTVQLTWPTFGATTGTRTLQAVTVINGVTNLAGVALAPVTVLAPEFAARAVNAIGSIGGRCNAVAVDGRHVYLGCGATLEIWDAILPASPVRLGAVRLPGLIEDVVARSNWVYVAAGAAGVQVVDVATASQPMHRATFDSTGHARQLALTGDLLYVADVLGGVRILNVANPAAPVLTGAYQTEGPAQTVTLAGSTLIVLDSYRGLQVLDVSTPAALVATGFLSRVTAGLAAAMAGNAVLVTEANAGVFRIDLTAPSAPVAVTNTLLPSSGRGLAISGSTLYVAAGAAGLLTLDATTLALNATTAVGGEASDVAVSGNTLYVAAGFAGCRSLDIASPLSPQPLATYATGARAVDADMSGPALFVAADEGGFQVHSLTNLAMPTWLTTVATSTNPRCLMVSGSLAYVAEALGGLKIYNVTDPAAPTLVGADPGSGLVTIRRLALSGTRLAMTDGRQISLLDVSNPAVPVLLATNVLSGYIFDLAANGTNVFAACGGSGLRILNNNDLGTVGAFSTAPAPVATVSVNGPYAYIGDGRATFRTLNITNPSAPTIVQASSGQGFGIASAGPLVYMVDARHQGAVLNVSAPLTPVAGLSLSNLTLGLRVRAQGGVVLTAEDEAGLGVFSASPNDINLNGLPDTVDQQIVDASTNDTLRSVWDVLPGDDFDHDGLSNLAESLVGTSPVDSSSVFAASAVNPVPGSGGGQFVIRWYSEAGKTYTIHKSTDLMAGFIPLQSGIADTAPLNSYTDTVSSATAFYMISVP